MTPEAISPVLDQTPLGLAAVPGAPVHLQYQGRLLYGSPEAGVTLRWADLPAEDLPTVKPASNGETVEILLNVTGEGVFRDGDIAWTVGEKTGSYFVSGRKAVRRESKAGQSHRFLQLSMDQGFLRRTLGACDGALDPVVEAFIQGAPPSFKWGGGRRLTMEHEQTVAQVLAPPVPQGARALWYQTKILQLIIDFLFNRPDADELFCDRQKRIARERVARVVTLLERGIAEPPSLAAIAKTVGCSPFYLSRTFSREMGMSIPQYLRRIRMEKAATLLATGRYNVTEAAVEVGYSSLSHFSQAFCQVIGCCPALYALKPRQGR